MFVFHDQTQERNMIKALRESEERLQFAREGVWDWNIATNEVFYSRQWKAMLGYADHEIQNRLEEWQDRVHPDDMQETYAQIRRHISGETLIYGSEHRIRCKDGMYKWILDRGKVVSRAQTSRR